MNFYKLNAKNFAWKFRTITEKLKKNDKIFYSNDVNDQNLFSFVVCQNGKPISV